VAVVYASADGKALNDLDAHGARRMVLFCESDQIKTSTLKRSILNRNANAEEQIDEDDCRRMAGYILARDSACGEYIEQLLWKAVLSTS
jgi:hypothetical protein